MSIRDSNSSIATITVSGNVLPGAVGVVEVSAQVGDLFTSIDLTVTSASLLRVDIDISDDDIVEGTTAQAQALGSHLYTSPSPRDF